MGQANTYSDIELNTAVHLTKNLLQTIHCSGHRQAINGHQFMSVFTVINEFAEKLEDINIDSRPR